MRTYKKCTDKKVYLTRFSLFLYRENLVTFVLALQYKDIKSIYKVLHKQIKNKIRQKLRFCTACINIST